MPPPSPRPRERRVRADRYFQDCLPPADIAGRRLCDTTWRLPASSGRPQFRWRSSPRYCAARRGCPVSPRRGRTHAPWPDRVERRCHCRSKSRDCSKHRHDRGLPQSAASGSLRGDPAARRSLPSSRGQESLAHWRPRAAPPSARALQRHWEFLGQDSGRSRAAWNPRSFQTDRKYRRAFVEVSPRKLCPGDRRSLLP